MTDEERQELAIHLRQMSHSLDVYSPDALRRAADEIERLSALAQSDAEPVAWGPSIPASSNMQFYAEPMHDLREESMRAVANRLHTSPRPDASAGLIEAARYLEKAKYGGGTPWQLGIRHGLEIAAKHLRARAADRSGK